MCGSRTAARLNWKSLLPWLVALSACTQPTSLRIRSSWSHERIIDQD